MRLLRNYGPVKFKQITEVGGSSDPPEGLAKIKVSLKALAVHISQYERAFGDFKNITESDCHSNCCLCNRHDIAYLCPSDSRLAHFTRRFSGTGEDVIAQNSKNLYRKQLITNM